MTRFVLNEKADFDNEQLRFTLRNTARYGNSIPSGTYALARNTADAHRYSLGHSLTQKVIVDCKKNTPDGAHIQFDYSSWAQKSESLEPLVGKAGILSFFHLAINGSDEQDHLIMSAIADNGNIIAEETARRFFDLPSNTIDKLQIEIPVALRNNTERRKNEILSELASRQANWFEEEIEKLNFWADDKRKGLKNELKEYDEQLTILKKEARLAPNLPEKLAIQKKLRDVDKKLILHGKTMTKQQN